VIAPLLGMLGAMLFTILVLNLFRRMNYGKSSRLFKYLQLVSATWYSIGHGTNDAQNDGDHRAGLTVAGWRRP
jgi:PiT family inorganic phosphate transporter